MNTQTETMPIEINDYEEYLSSFLPKLAQTTGGMTVTAEEIGIKMAEETLTHIRELLAKDKMA